MHDNQPVDIHSYPIPMKTDRRSIEIPTNFNKLLEAQNEFSHKIAKHQERSELPKLEPSVFDGSDVTTFRTFMCNYNRIVHSKCDSNDDRFYYLKQYTSGTALKLVQCFDGFDPDAAYDRAVSILEEKYENEYKNASAYLSKLQQWPRIKGEDGPALQDLSIFLLPCLNSMDRM